MDIRYYTHQIVIPQADSHKGDNGRVLVIGGSKLFHAAAFWSASMASKIVDMVHFTSPVLENNDLMRVRAKEKFWDGIVIDWQDVDHYIEEDDCILIGPGMERGEETKGVVDGLLRKYPDKKWIVDGGALQMVDSTLLTSSMIITPNKREVEVVGGSVPDGVVVLAKGPVDHVTDGYTTVEIPGGNPGMTKGGTGDVLAGLVVALAARSPHMAAAVVASYVNKQASTRLATRVGVYYSASDLIPAVQDELGRVLAR